MKTMERIILNCLRSLVGSELDPLQFAYQSSIGVDDAVIYLLHRSYLHLEDAGRAVRIRGAATDSGPPGQHIHSGPPAFWGGGRLHMHYI